MKISELKDENIKVGMKIRSMAPSRRTGTIVKISYPPEDRYQYAWIQWDGDEWPTSGFWENQCECEVVSE